MRKNLFLLILLATMPVVMFAQFSLSGRITSNDNNEPLPGAHIVLNSVQKSTVSNDNGYYKFENLPKGEYQIKVSYVGLKTIVIDLDINKNTTKNISLTPSVIFSEEVIISAIRASDESPTTYTIMNQKEIEKRNTGRDLPYILKTTPSVIVSSDAGAGVGYTDMRIRGTNLTGINVTLNGVPVNDAESHTVYFVDLPDLASSINDVQIQRGVGTSTVGAASFGASININTADNSKDPYTELSSAFGSFNTLKSTLKFGTGLMNNHWNFGGRLSYVKSDGYVDRASSNLKSAYFSGGYTGDRDIFKAVILLGSEKTYQSWSGIPKDSLDTNRTYNPEGAMYDSQGDFIGYYDNQTDNYNQNYYQLHYAHSFSDKLNLASSAFLTTGKGYYESYKNDQDFNDYGITDTIIGNDTITTTDLIRQKWLDNYYYGLNLSLNYTSSKLEINFGGGWNHYDGDHYGKIIWAQVIPQNQLNKNYYFNTGKKTDINFFAKANYKINQKLNLYGDIQYRTINYDIDGIHDDLGDLTQSHTYNFINPKAGVFYSLKENQHLYFSVGVSNREPNRSIYRDADTSQNIVPERLIDFELGYKYQAEKLNLEANLFYMDYKDQFVMTGKINNVGTAIMTNVDKSFRAGIELMAGVKLARIVDWNFNTTLSTNKINNFVSYVDNWDTWVQEVDTLGKTDISFSPSIIINNDISVSPVKNLRLSFVTKYVGRQYIDNTSNKERSLDPYLVNNLNIYYTIHTNFIKQIDLMLSLNNIFNEEYESKAWVYRYYSDNLEQEMNGYFPQAGFNFMMGVNLKF